MEIKELGHVVLYVSDIERSRWFYRDVLGFQEVRRRTPRSIATFSSGRTHHELLLIEVGSAAAAVPTGPRLGLYHIGLKVGETIEVLRQSRDELAAAGVAIRGCVDHGWTKSLYVEDPDGIEVELYVDGGRATWQGASGLSVMSEPLQL